MYAASYKTGQVELFEMHCFPMFITSLCDIFLCHNIIQGSDETSMTAEQESL